MGKTRDLFRKMRDTKGTFHAKMGSIKDRNGLDLTEAEDIKKKWSSVSKFLPPTWLLASQALRTFSTKSFRAPPGCVSSIKTGES